MNTRKYSLDVLKFFATIIIILHHYQQMIGTAFPWKVKFFGGNFYWGYLVEFFFLISGYVTYKYVHEINQDSSFLLFWWKKYIRFLPMLALGCTGSLIISTILYETLIFDFGTILTSYLGIQRWLSTSSMVNNPTWYISVLLLCFCVFFFVTYIAKRLKVNPNTMYVLMVVIGLLMIHRCRESGESRPFLSYPIGRGYYTFFTGILLRHILETTGVKKHIATIPLSLGFIIAFIILFIKAPDFFHKDYTYVLSFLIFPAVITLFEHDLFTPVFSGSWLKELGGLSFNAYLWHVNVINLMRILARRFEITLESHRWMALVTLIALLVGLLSHRFIERPINSVITKIRTRSKTDIQ